MFPSKTISVSKLLCSIATFLYISRNVLAIDEIKIGVLIRHRGLEEPLNRTLEMLNADTSVLFTTRLIAIVEIIESDNSYQASAAGEYLII